MGNTHGAGCNICVRKGIKCEYSVKKKPGPKSRKREDEDGVGAVGPVGVVDDDPAMNPFSSCSVGLNGTGAQSLSPNHGGGAAAVRPQGCFPLRAGSGRSGSFDTEDGGEFGGGSGGGGVPGSPSSRHLLTPSKKAKPTHDKGTRAARRQAEEDEEKQQLLLPVRVI